MFGKIRTLLLLGTLTLAGLSVAMFAGVTAASARPALECSSCTPWWHVNVSTLPTNLVKGEEAEVSVFAEDMGDAGPTSAIVLSDKLPKGLTATKVDFGVGLVDKASRFFEGFCKVSPEEVTCEMELETAEALGFNRAFANMEMYIHVNVANDATSGEENEATASGGGAPTVSVSRPISVTGEPTKFGPEQYELKPENPDGSQDTQAGSHPFQLTTTLLLNQTPSVLIPPAPAKDLRFQLPPGLIGNPSPFPQCPLSKFIGNAMEGQNFCPDNTAVGIASVTITIGSEPTTFAVPLFALVPSTGEPARFAFDILGVPVYLDTGVRTGSDYGVTVTVPNITEAAGFVSSRVSIWGVPGDPRHDSVRGWNCIKPQEDAPPCVSTTELQPPPLLTMPTSCTGPVTTSIEADSWKEEGTFNTIGYTFVDNLGRPVGMDGCNQLPFTPSVKITPDGQAGSTPTGLTVDEHVPQEGDLNPTGLSEAAVKGLTVTLPNGVALNPAAADGLSACSLQQVELQNKEPTKCPESSKLATVKIKTPLLPNPLEGAAYLATQDANPFGSLVAMYIYATDPVSGVTAKATGEVVENPETGQITAIFEKDPLFANDPKFANEPATQFLPEVPFEDIELHFFGGDRAPLATPARCGSYSTRGTFTPWSGNATTESTSSFNVISGPNATPCADPLPFAPTLTSGTTSIQAGGFSPFVLTMSRQDGEQNLQAIKLQMPPGLLGTLSTVKLCGEPQADEGKCGPETQIGETIVSVGVGGDPFTVKGGRVYITGPYNGSGPCVQGSPGCAPYGLAIVNPAKAGPFDLGQVVVRAKIEVNPVTAQLTITTDNEGPYKIPHIIDGIPLQIQHVNVSINRPDFTFNPTNCSPQEITGALSSTEGASKALAVPFQATNCAVLAFKPSLEASTSGKTSRTEGASLKVKLAYPAGPYDANIAKVKVELPVQLPSRLTTLQKACTIQVFNANPANCPEASKIGAAVATTPVLPTSLSGPAYFVSHGGAQFPELIIVLQGYGTTVYLHGETFISKQGVTSSTFATIPDVPVGTFELTLPQGPNSALGANTNLCKSKLTIPTEFIGQNGAELHESTNISVAGCPKVTKVKKKQKKSKSKKGKGAKHKGKKK